MVREGGIKPGSLMWLPLFFSMTIEPDIGDQIVVGRPFAEQRPQIVIFLA